MKTVVQFDVDGVLADFGGGYDRLCIKMNKPAPGPAAPWDSKWDRMVWDEINTSLTFWESLDPLAHRRVFERIATLTCDVYFVTARPGRQTKWQTENWLVDQGLAHPTVIVTDRKAEFAKAVGVTHAIDDKAGNAVAIQYLAPQARSFLLDAPYNLFDQSVLGSKVLRVFSVGEFLDAVEFA